MAGGPVGDLVDNYNGAPIACESAALDRLNEGAHPVTCVGVWRSSYLKSKGAAVVKISLKKDSSGAIVGSYVRNWDERYDGFKPETIKLACDLK